VVSKTELEAQRQAYPDLPWPAGGDAPAQQAVAERPPEHPDDPAFETPPGLAAAP
jgi:hypothetical protein